MKSHIFLLLLLVPLSTFSQSPVLTNSLQIDGRLNDVFEKDYIEKVQKEEPFLIERWNFYLNNAFFISDNALRKNEVAAEYPSVQIPNLGSINILKLEKEQNLKHDFYTETIYKIAGIDKYLVYYAGKDFVEKFNAHMKMIRESTKTD